MAGWDQAIEGANRAADDGTVTINKAAPGDSAERLPEDARARLGDLRRQRDEVRTLMHAISDELQEANLDVQRAQTQLNILVDPMAASRVGKSGLRLADDDPRVVEARQRVEAKRKRLEELTTRHAEQAETFQALLTLVNRLERWLADVPGSIAAHSGKLPGPRKGEDAEAAVERLRDARAELASQLREVRSAPRTAEELKAQARTEVEALAGRGAPRIDQDGGVIWPEMPIRTTLNGFAAAPDGQPANLQGFGAGEAPDALALLAWLNSDGLLAKIEAQIDAETDETAALSANQRHEREAELLAQILEMERAECALITASRVPIAYRADTDPRAVLGIDGPMPRDPWQ